MRLHQNLPNKHKRLGILLVFVGVLSLWSIVLPPTDSLEYELNKESADEIKIDSHTLHLKKLQVDSLDLKSWDLPLVSVQNEKSVEVVKKPIEKIKKMNNIPVVVQASITPPQMQKPSFNFPPVKYLGQVVEQSNLLIFLNIDGTNVMMKRGNVYEQTWKIVSVDDYAVELQHVPSQKMLSIPKL